MSRETQETVSVETLRTAEAIAETWEQFKIEAGLSDHPVVMGLEEGRTLAQIQGLTRDDLEVLYTQGYRLLIQGLHDKAQIIFTQLVMIDPLIAKNHYCLGVCHQQVGDAGRALGLFEISVALDATNPEGLMRMGECHLALGHPEDAATCFSMALAEVQKGHGVPDAAQRADALLQTVQKGA